MSAWFDSSRGAHPLLGEGGLPEPAGYSRHETRRKESCGLLTRGGSSHRNSLRPRQGIRFSLNVRRIEAILRISGVHERRLACDCGQGRDI